MNTTLDQANTILVTERIQQFEEIFAEKVTALRTLILKADASIKEKIEWNFPCFYIGESCEPSSHVDREKVLIEMNLRHNKIILVFPTGNKVKGATGIYEGSYKDGRRIVPLGDLEDINEKAQLLTAVIQKWVKVSQEPTLK